MILLCGRKDALFPYQCLVGPDWPCMLVTYSIITVPTVFFFVLVYVGGTRHESIYKPTRPRGGAGQPTLSTFIQA